MIVSRHKWLLVLWLFVIIPILVRGERYVNDSLKIDGVWRKFAMLLPDGLEVDAPLVFVLHGHGGGIWKENPMAAPARRH